MIHESAGIAKKQYLPKHKEQFRQMGIPYYEEMEDKKHDRTHICNRYTQRSTPDPADHLRPASDHHHRLHTTRHSGNHTHPKKTNPLHPAKKHSDISPFTFHLNFPVFCHRIFQILAENIRFVLNCTRTGCAFISTSNDQKSARGRWSACMAGICNDVRKSWHSEAPENGSGEVLPALERV